MQHLSTRTHMQKAVALAALQDEFEQVNKTYFKSSLPKCNIRAMRAGAYKYGSFRHGLYSGKTAIIINLEYPWKDMKDTLRHEIAHLKEFSKFGKTSDASAKFACYCALLEVSHTIYRGKFAHRVRRGT